MLFPCERVDFGNLFEIGDATSDVDAEKVFDFLVERIRLGCDCGNCIINEVCTLCPAQVTESRESPGYPDSLSLRRTCQEFLSGSDFVARLEKYTEIMEANPKVLDWLYPEKNPRGAGGFGSPAYWFSQLGRRRWSLRSKSWRNLSEANCTFSGKSFDGD